MDMGARVRRRHTRTSTVDEDQSRAAQGLLEMALPARAGIDIGSRWAVVEADREGLSLPLLAPAARSQGGTPTQSAKLSPHLVNIWSQVHGHESVHVVPQVILSTNEIFSQCTHSTQE
jgi:hypothetical protein